MVWGEGTLERQLGWGENTSGRPLGGEEERWALECLLSLMPALVVLNPEKALSRCQLCASASQPPDHKLNEPLFFNLVTDDHGDTEQTQAEVIGSFCLVTNPPA